MKLLTTSIGGALILSCLILRGAEGKGKKKAPAPPPDEDETIEDVDEDRIDEIVAAGETHLVVLLYDRPSRCPLCEQALSEMEEIDDDLERAHIEVVKSDDKHLALENGIHTLPALIYFRRRHPILYDGEFGDSKDILKWVRTHGEVVTEELDDNDFEDETEAYAPDDEDLDWFVMFYSTEDELCEAYIPVWETVAHKLRGLVEVGRVDIEESDDVAERFKIDDDDDCPTFLLFHKGKMHRYKDAARDVKSLSSFALHRFKEQRGHRVPEPPSFIEDLYEEIKEGIAEFFENNLLGAIGSIVLLIAAAGGGYYALKVYRRKKEITEEEKDE